MKVIAPAALNALKDALSHVYWYKPDLRSFLVNTFDNHDIISRLDWNTPKRSIVSNLVDHCARNQDIYQEDLLRLMRETSRVVDFSHLSRLEDGTLKAKRAQEAVSALRIQLGGFEKSFDTQETKDNKRAENNNSILYKKGLSSKLDQIKLLVNDLIVESNAQRRGFKFEVILNDLFDTFDLNPKKSFKNLGEQIDGAFTFENTDYLLEAKWEKGLIGIQDLDAFKSKIERKLDNTLGLFVAFNGFSSTSVQNHASGRCNLILMDGADLMAVLEGRISLLELLLRKRRCAAQTGNIYLSVNEILRDK
ncbi:Restriction endonuclease [Abditibacterium utsteinense]|uniref:Restriction endonuclease n=1 Tax=Abditibacterium utsteinense TaxID=1960156 RepID=A0A2S8SS45_9BACT|nr:restriction endonuclease [Abditibacterium utsteinense]PQV63620.1 Restriction endonuclease [Abditibacterium utsteinense]